jgi:hypothetical protein
MFTQNSHSDIVHSSGQVEHPLADSKGQLLETGGYETQ